MFTDTTFSDLRKLKSRHKLKRTRELLDDQDFELQEAINSYHQSKNNQLNERG